MIAPLVASAAVLFAGSALASGLGSAVIINNCDYQIHLAAVPASGGGQKESDQILNTGDTFKQQWTPLSNFEGWSIKVSRTTVMRNIMQYEYTYNNDNNVWWDMSEVDGNPWDGNYMLTAQSDGNKCQPRQAAYRWSTDDQNGMQDACEANAVITLTLCSGENGTTPDGGAAYGSPSQSSAPSSAAPAPVQVASQAAPAPVQVSSQAAPAPVQVSSQAAPVPVQVSSQAAPPPASTTSTIHTSSSVVAAVHVASSSSSPAAPASSAAPTYIPIAGGADGVWTTLATVTQTDYVTIDTTVTAYATVAARKRHEHHAGRHARD